MMRRWFLAALLLLAPAFARAQSATDNFTFTPGVSKTNIDGGVVDDTSPATTDENKSGHARMTPLGALHFNLRNQAGTEIGTVANPVQVGDGGGSLTIDGTVSISGTVTVSDGSGALTVDGTVAIGAALPAGTNNIGDVDVLTLPSVTIGTFPDNEPFNVAQINGATPLTGNGVTGTGSLRVTIASDNTAFTVNAAQSGTWNINNVSGIVSLPTGAATSANQTTEIASLQALDNIPQTEDTASASGDSGVTIFAQRASTPANTSSANGDYEPLQVNGGRLWVSATVDTALPTGTNNIGDVDVLTLPALPTGSNEIGRIRITDGTDLATVLNLAGEDPLAVAIVDSAGAQITSFGGGTQYTEGDVDATITGTAMLWEDTSNTLRPVASGTPLPVNVVAGGAGDGKILDGTASGQADVLDYTNSRPLAVRLTDTNGDYVGAGAGTQYTVNAVAPADPTGTAGLMERDDALSALSEIEGDWTNQRSNANGALWVAGDGTFIVGDGSGALTVDGTVNAAQSGTWNITNITGTVSLPTGAATSANQSTEITALQLIDNIVSAEDTASANLDGGAVVLAKRTDTAPAATSNLNGDYEPLQVNGGRLWVSALVDTALPAGNNNIGDIDVASLPAVTIGTFPDNEPFNVAQINGVAPLMGNGVTGTGSLRVTIASDNTAFTVNAAQSGTWNINNISGTVSLPTGAATSANQVSEITSLQLLDDVVEVDDSSFVAGVGSIVVAGCLEATDTMDAGDVGGVKCGSDRELDMDLVSPIPAGTNNIGDVDVLTLPSVTVGTFPDNEPFNVAQINGVTPLMGNGVTGTGSLRVTIASDNTAFTVNAAQSGTWNINNISGTVSLPTGAATSANQTTQTTSLQLIDDLVATEDQASANLDEGTVLLALRKASPANTSDTDLDYEALQMANGRLYTSSTIDAAVPAGNNNIGDVDVATLPSVTIGTFPDNEPFNVAQINGVTPLMGNGVTGTGSLRVTVASDNTAFSVNALQSGTWSNRITDGTDTAQVFDLAANDPLSVAIVDGSGTQITSFGGGVEYTEDVAAAADPVGKAVNLVRADTPATVTSTNGDNIAQRGTNYGAAYVQLVTSAGAFIDSVGGGTEFNEDAAHSTGALGKLNLAVRNDAGTAFTSADGDYSPMRVDSAGNVATFLTDGSETATVRDTGTSDSVNVAIVDASGNQITSFGGGSQFAVDAVAGATDLGTLALVVRDDALSTLTPVDGDYTQLRVTSQGRLYASATIDTSLPAGTNNIGDIDVVSWPDNEPFNLAQVGGGTLASHDAAVAGAPVIVGTTAETPEDTTPSNRVSADADAVRMVATRDGQQYVAPYGPQIWESSAEYTTAQTDTSLKAAPGAGLSFYITDITIVCNAAVTVSLEEDDATDDLIDKMYCSGLGGGHERHLITPHKTTANQALLLTTSAAVTVFVAVSGYTAP